MEEKAVPTKMVNARITQGQVKKLSYICDETGMTVSDVLRKGIEIQYKNERETNK